MTCRCPSERRSRHEARRNEKRPALLRYSETGSVPQALPDAVFLDGDHGRDRQRHGRGHPPVPAARHRPFYRREDHGRHRRLPGPLYSGHARPDGHELHLCLRRVQGRALHRPGSQARGLQPPADALVLLFQPEQRRLHPRPRHVGYRPHRKHAGLGTHGGRVVHRVSAVRRRHDVRAQLASGAVRDGDRAGPRRLGRVFPEEARLLPPPGARAELAHHRRVQRGHHRREDHQNARDRG